MLVKSPDTHHANHLSLLAKEAENSPCRILNIFLTAKKNKFTEDVLTHKDNNIKSSLTTTKNENINFVDIGSSEPETLTEVSTIDTITSMFKVGKRSKFIVN